MSRVSTTRRLPGSVVAAINASTILGVRAGARTEHRFIGIWAVVVNGRVFARSWKQARGGWYHTFLTDPVGTIQVGNRELRVRAPSARRTAARRRRTRVRRQVSDARLVEVRPRSPHTSAA